jgi:hypothetical protein
MSRVRVQSGVGVAWLAASLAWTAPEAPGEPVLVAIVVDASGSLGARDLDTMRRLSLGLLEQLPPASEAALFAFADQSRLALPRSADREAVRQALAALAISGQRTALHDALYDATRYLRDAGPGRKAILLLTDGRDEGSVLTLEDGLRLAEDHAIPVFAIGMGRVEERVLRRIAKLTAGEYVTARRAAPERLAARILAQPDEPSEAPAPSLARGEAGRRSGPAPRAAAEADASPLHRLGRAWQAAALGLLVLLGSLAAWRALRRQPRPRCATCGRELPAPDASCELCVPGPEPRPTLLGSELSPTLLERLSHTEEYLDKTVVLRDEHVLAITHGPLAGTRFPLSLASALSLGRSKANDVVLEDPSISSQHCRIRPTTQGGFMVHDLKSTNGTYVNEKRVTQHALADGDVIRVGETHLQLRRDQSRGANAS